MGRRVPKPEPFAVTGTVSGNEARFIPQDGLLFRHADTQVSEEKGWKRWVTAYEVFIDFVSCDTEH